jgi:predicted PolB exonuclease-like 3'-5' exonuclease
MLKNILFLDIETVPAFSEYEDLPTDLKPFWIKKAKFLLRKDIEEMSASDVANVFLEKAGIYAEFARIVCISVGYFSMDGSSIKGFRTKSFFGNDEKEILIAFNQMLHSHYYNPEKHKLSGHNIREFDLPFLCRRNIINRLALPNLLKLSGKKPWQTTHILDTMEMWKFGDYKSYTSLGLLTALLDIPSPKDEMDGSMVSRAYWKEQDLKSIVKYCEKDVVSVARLYLKLTSDETIEDELISSATEMD